MKKDIQKAINTECKKSLKLWEDAVCIETREQLLTCKAQVLTTDNNLVGLVSYNTLVAIIDRNTRTFYDILRYTYGYTSTSAQHIAKFKNMCRHTFDTEYRYYPVK